MSVFVADAKQHGTQDVEELKAEIREIWSKVCGEQESLSYCEFLCVLLPPIDDSFEDEGPHSMRTARPLKPVVIDESMAGTVDESESLGVWQVAEELPNYW